jgi:hypothetical protein
VKTWLRLTAKCNQLQPNPKMAVFKRLKMVARDGIGTPTALKTTQLVVPSCR